MLNLVRVADTPAPEKTRPNHFTSASHIIDLASLRVMPFSLALSSVTAIFLLCSVSSPLYTSRLSWIVMHPPKSREHLGDFVVEDP